MRLKELCSSADRGDLVGGGGSNVIRNSLRAQTVSAPARNVRATARCLRCLLRAKIKSRSPRRHSSPRQKVGRCQRRCLTAKSTVGDMRCRNTTAQNRKRRLHGTRSTRGLRRVSAPLPRNSSASFSPSPGRRTPAQCFANWNASTAVYSCGVTAMDSRLAISIVFSPSPQDSDA
jgi:hypothetical protein